MTPDKLRDNTSSPSEPLSDPDPSPTELDNVPRQETLSSPQTSGTEASKPAGVFIIGGLLIFYGLSGISGPMVGLDGSQSSSAEVMNTSLQLVVTLAAIVLGVGLLKFIELFRKITLFAVFANIGYLLTVLNVSHNGGALTGTTAYYLIATLVTALVISGVVVAYLTRPKVKSYFK